MRADQRSSQPQGEEIPGVAIMANAETSQTTLGALRVVISAGWVSRVAALQLASIDTLRTCRETSSFRLRIARKTPRRVYKEKFAGVASSSGSGGSSSSSSSSRGTTTPVRSGSRVVLPHVTRLLYDKSEFEPGPDWSLPVELIGLVLGTAFGGDIDGVVWPPALESVVFWRRWVHAFWRAGCRL